MSDYSFDIFPTKFFQLDVEDSLCYELLRDIDSNRREMELINNTHNKQPSEDYITDYRNPVKLKVFDSIMENLKAFFGNIGYDFILRDYWTAIYNGFGSHTIHTHKGNITNHANYSGILYLTSIGSTEFFSSCPHSWDKVFTYPSQFGKILMFPSMLPHHAVNEVKLDNERYVVAFNADLKINE